MTIRHDPEGSNDPMASADAVLATDTAESGGEPACWAHLVCPECAMLTTEGHRDGCSLAADAESTG